MDRGVAAQTALALLRDLAQPRHPMTGRSPTA